MENEKLTSCPDCGKTISKKANICIHCGCPLIEKEGYVIFKYAKYIGEGFGGIFSKCIIKTKEGKLLAKLKPNEQIKIAIKEETTLLCDINTTMWFPKSITCFPNEEKRYTIFVNYSGHTDIKEGLIG